MPIDKPISHDALAAKIAFSKIKGINISTAATLLDRIGDYSQYFALSDSQLSALTGLDRRLTNSDYRSSLLAEAEKEAQFVAEKSINAVLCCDSAYPRRLNDCNDAPALLYSIGSCNLDCLHSVAIVGTRHATPYGLDFVRHLVDDLAAKIDNLIIVSGLAYGIDIAAHRTALDNNIPTVAVVAHGLNTIYPADHRSTAARIVKEGGAIVTEYSSDAVIHRGNFLARNRIIAGLADVVVVVESDTRGGAMSTARIAAAYNHEVMAAPGRVTDTYSRGCNALIAEHTASIIRSADDLISLLGWTPVPKPQTQTAIRFEMTPEQRTVAQHIVAHPDHTVNDICVALGIPFNLLSSILFEMEMSDMIMTIPGGRYAVIASE